MANLYGSYLIEGHENYKQYYSKFETRIESLSQLAESTVRAIEKKYPELKGVISVSYSNIVLVASRYFNDVVRLKAMHKIENLNHSKMFAYTTKWMISNPALVCTAPYENLWEMDSNARRVALSANNLMIMNLLAYFFENLGYAKPAVRKQMSIDITYLIKTMLYEEHCIASMVANFAYDGKAL